MNITADTNVLLRASLADDAVQSPIATEILARAALVAVPLAVFCEFAWVMRNARRPAAAVASAVRDLISVSKVRCDREAVEAGLAVLEAGGDFADGVIEQQGRKLGGEVLATFDRDAARLLKRGGSAVRLLG